ncbi:MAG: tetratricopeptide repeat protein [bacterium]
MTSLRPTLPFRLGLRHAVLLLPSALLLTGCAYFNTFHNARGYYREGVELSRQNQVAQARAKFEKAVEKSAMVLSRWPGSRWADDATFLIGQSYYEMGQYGKAIRHLDQLVLAFPSSPYVPRARYYRGLAMLRNREYGPARVLLEQVRREYPHLRDGAAFHLASSFHDREEWARAADSLRAFLEQYPKSGHRIEALRRMAVSCERLGDPVDCERAYRRLIDAVSEPRERAAVRLKIAAALVAQGRYDEALPAVREVVGRYPEHADEANVLLGRALAETDRPDEALETWRKVRGSTDFGAEAFFRIGRHHEELREFAVARANYDTARSRRANSDFGVMALKRLTLLDAIARSDSVGEREPGEALFLLAEIHNLNLAEYDEAQRLYQAVRDSYPDTEWAPKALLARAWITRYAEDDSAGSVPELEQLIAEYPKSEYADEARRWLGLPAPPRKKPEVAVAPPAPPAQPVESAPVEPVAPPDIRDDGSLPGELLDRAGEVTAVDSITGGVPVLPGETAGRAERERVRARPERHEPPPVVPTPPADKPAPVISGDTAFGPVHFDFDRADVRDADSEPLRRVAAWLREHPDRRLRLTGHCDPRGEDDYNLGLGRRRAEAVRAWLEGAGIDPVRLEARTRGSSATVSSGPGEYWLDRRVEFSFL